MRTHNNNIHLVTCLITVTPCNERLPSSQDHEEKESAEGMGTKEGRDDDEHSQECQITTHECTPPALHVSSPPPTKPYLQTCKHPHANIHTIGTQTWCLVLHDVSPQAEGDAYMEEDSIAGSSSRRSITWNVLHRVLYPKAHVNGDKKKKKNYTLTRVRTHALEGQC